MTIMQTSIENLRRFLNQQRARRSQGNRSYQAKFYRLSVLVLLILLTVDLCSRCNRSSTYHQVHAAIDQRHNSKRTTDSNIRSYEHYYNIRRSNTKQQEQQESDAPKRPECRYDPTGIATNATFPLGHKWTPFLEGAIQECLLCECTLRYQPAFKCYKTAITCIHLDRPPRCPYVPDRCPDGGLPQRQAPGKCCKTCDRRTGQSQDQPTRSSSDARSRYMPGSLWKVGDKKQGTTSSSAPSSPSQQQNRNTTPVNLYFDQATSPETYYLFKIIARSSDNREVISAVKSVTLCPG